MKTTYNNRYGDIITFEKVDDKEVKMSGYVLDFMRCGYDDEFNSKKVIMVDPAGGPYIQINSNLKFYFNLKDDLIVKEIDLQSDHIIFKCK